MKKLNRLLIMVSLLALIVTAIAPSVAWYRPVKMNFGEVSVKGSIRANYFESGDGTGSRKYTENPGSGQEGCAYEIATPEQFYNLAWLQYLGYFNGEDPEKIQGDNLATTYFYLSDNLDMTGYVLPPIGTTDNPFIGNFDGNNHTISNLTVANTTQNGTGLDMATGESDVTGTEIIGLFGVIGAYNGSPEYTYNNEVNEVKNVTINNLTVNSQTDRCLIGLVAGYVNGTVENVGVANSRIQIKDGTAILDATNLSAGYSDSSLFGYCTDTYRETKSHSYFYDFDTTGAGQQPDWGGSIVMLDIYKRLTYMFGRYGFSGNAFNGFNVSLKNNDMRTQPFTYKRSYYSKRGSNETYAVYYMSRGYMPISIDVSCLEQDEVVTTTFVDAALKPNVVTNDYYRDNDVEPILDSNNGYIVGDVSNNNTGPRIAFKPGHWISGAADREETWGYIDGSWQIITPANSPNTSRYVNYWNLVKPTLFGVPGYSDGTLFQETVEADGNTYTYTPSLSFEASRMGATDPLNLHINGQDVTMPLLKNGIDFFLQSDGVISVAMATNFNSTGTHNGADLFVVDRSSGTPVRRRIERIYTHNDDNSVVYVLENQSDTYAGNSNYTLKFDYTWMWNWSAGRLYYFEIPVTKGPNNEYKELFITNSRGSAGNSGTYASFVYLDIGANGGDGDGPGGADGRYYMKEKVYEHTAGMSADFVARPGTELDAEIPTAELLLSGTGTYDFRRDENTVFVDTESGAIKPIYIKNDAQVSVTGTDSRIYTPDDVDYEDTAYWTYTGDPYSWMYVNGEESILKRGKDTIPNTDPHYDEVVAAFEKEIAISAPPAKMMLSINRRPSAKASVAPGTLPDAYYQTGYAFRSDSVDFSTAALPVGLTADINAYNQPVVLQSTARLASPADLRNQSVYDLTVPGDMPLIFVQGGSENGMVTIAYTVPENTSGVLVFDKGDGELVDLSELAGVTCTTEDGVHYVASFPATEENIRLAAYCGMDAQARIQSPDAGTGNSSILSGIGTYLMSLFSADEGSEPIQTFVLAPACYADDIELNSITLRSDEPMFGTVELRCADGDIAETQLTVYYEQAANAGTNLKLQYRSSDIVVFSDLGEDINVDAQTEYVSIAWGAEPPEEVPVIQPEETIPEEILPEPTEPEEPEETIPEETTPVEPEEIIPEETEEVEETLPEEEALLEPVTVTENEGT